MVDQKQLNMLNVVVVQLLNVGVETATVLCIGIGKCANEMGSKLTGFEQIGNGLDISLGLTPF